MLVGLGVGSTTVTISDRSGNTSVSFVVYVVEKPVPVQPENPISEETIENISNAMDNMELSEEQTEKSFADDTCHHRFGLLRAGRVLCMQAGTHRRSADGHDGRAESRLLDRQH